MDTGPGASEPPPPSDLPPPRPSKNPPVGSPPRLTELIDTDESANLAPDEPFFMEASPTHACLLIHGSTGTAADLRPLGDFLFEKGYTVRGISLPGHATRPAQLEGIGWRDCDDVVRAAFRELRGSFAHVSVIGFSYGGSLALHLAAHEPVENLIVLAPGIHVYISARDILAAGLGILPGTWMHARLRWSLNLLGFFRIVAGELSAIRCPILVMHARDDPLVQHRSSVTAFDGVSTRDRRLVMLNEGGHLLPWGPAHARVWDEVASRLSGWEQG